MSGHVLVTGASRGIGREVSRLLVKLGHEVTGIHRKVSAASTELGQELGASLRLMQTDLTDPEAMNRVAANLARSGPVAGVVLNAGITHSGSFTDIPPGPDPLDVQILANLLAPLRFLRCLLRSQVLVQNASIVVVTSNLARRGLAGRVAYSAAKAGLESAVRGLSHELGSSNIRINAVAPGLLRTDMTADVDEHGFAAYAAEVPLGRVGEAADVAPLIAFLLGDGAQYISGQIIDVDGGWSG